jgi:hypothetical protein
MANSKIGAGDIEEEPEAPFNECHKVKKDS